MADEKSDRKDVEPLALFARPAVPADCEAFLELARYCVEETGAGPLNEDAARYTFAGIARCEPAIHVLFACDELVGFAIVRNRACPLTGKSTVHQEKLFVRADVRSAETEALLHGMSNLVVQATRPAEAFLYIATSEHSQHVYSRLVATGYEVAGVQMTFRSSDAPPPRIEQATCELNRPVLH